jgi:hypothetical protein
MGITCTLGANYCLFCGGFNFVLFRVQSGAGVRMVRAGVLGLLGLAGLHLWAWWRHCYLGHTLQRCGLIIPELGRVRNLAPSVGSLSLDVTLSGPHTPRVQHLPGAVVTERMGVLLPQALTVPTSLSGFTE